MVVLYRYSNMHTILQLGNCQLTPVINLMLEPLESLLQSQGISTIIKCTETTEDFQSAITTMKKMNVFNVLLDINIDLLPEFFENCRWVLPIIALDQVL